ncbi:hypothetical protein [Cytobacillus sp. NCCP-133]|uniref:hypothetical protein n=1 Tax=Cytobacillus sp. NCCP-133 TaxID=766848 RepID=UPI00222F9C0C|nr:hypothetical protein [Cytobacillus sp. NCCP-133]GLB60386.1 hypothetical protein NCCP133_25180 [Cytobacillus sp. NCCP-133]
MELLIFSLIGFAAGNFNISISFFLDVGSIMGANKISVRILKWHLYAITLLLIIQLLIRII